MAGVRGRPPVTVVRDYGGSICGSISKLIPLTPDVRSLLGPTAARRGGEWS